MIRSIAHLISYNFRYWMFLSPVEPDSRTDTMSERRICTFKIYVSFSVNILVILIEFGIVQRSQPPRRIAAILILSYTVMPSVKIVQYILAA